MWQLFMRKLKLFSKLTNLVINFRMNLEGLHMHMRAVMKLFEGFFNKLKRI